MNGQSYHRMRILFHDPQLGDITNRGKAEIPTGVSGEKALSR